MTGLAVESLLDAVLVPEKAVRHVNFFNGRVLTAGDLKAEQVADRQGRQQLGRAIGSGVATGLEVSLVSDGTDGRAPVIEVTGGLAITPSGQATELVLERVNVALARRTPLLPIDVGLFDDCDQLPPAGDLTGRGTYVLAITAASAFREQAPMVGVGGEGIAKGCGDRYAVEGVAFRLVEIPASALAGLSQAARDEITTLGVEAEEQSLAPIVRRARLSRLRNVLANACLGAADEQAWIRDPWRPARESTGVVDAMYACAALRPWDTPLALVHWTSRGVQFVDRWSVRRRPTAPAASRWAAIEARRRADGEARFLQFEDQAAELLTSARDAPFAAQLRLADSFRLLPPVGLIPLMGGGAGTGFDVDVVTDGLTFRDRVHIAGTRLGPLIEQSFGYAPVDVMSGEMLWTYVVRENVQAIDAAAVPLPATALVFSTGHLPYQGDPQYDLAQWSYANYGPGVADTPLEGG